MTTVLPSSKPVTRAGGAASDRGLTVPTGLSGLSLDAMASVSYGPEAIVLVLAAAGAAGLGMTLPVTLTITVLLALLIASYRQVIAVFPNGGGAYAVAKAQLGDRAALVAAASLIVDYVLNVAVSIAAGVAALTSAFPALHGYTVRLCLAVLLGITAVNLLGIAHSARVFMAPTIVFVAGICTVIVAGLLRTEPASVTTAAATVTDVQTVGVLLLLKAFSSGCAALTGVEAIANAVPSFRAPGIRRAQRAEVALGALLGTMLIGLALLIEKFALHPVAGTTVLSQLTEAALGHGIGYYIVQFATVVLLALAANTSYGGLPTLTRLLADDNCLPHRFAVSSPRRVYRYGVLALGVCAAVLLIAARGNMNALVPLFAIGVFVGFTLAQVGMVRHWWTTPQADRRRLRLALNGFGAAATGVAALVTTAMKFREGAWLIVVVLTALVFGMRRVRRAYRLIGTHRRADAVPPPPRPHDTVVVVPVAEVSGLTCEALSTALSLGSEVVAVHVCLDDERADEFTAAWDDWHPDVPLVLLPDRDATVGGAVAHYLRQTFPDRRKIVVVAEVDPPTGWDRVLPSHRSDELERTLRRMDDTVVCHLRVQAV
ncbi:APC family permease [Nocardia cyriacigeorgica]|uniref:APC family permease n=1 Tax=Nocardia cyriacigeorgica TaxID=135487 RepID=UPI0024571DFA|nr:APC family permease [Nocardia cyriacigeorgica]